MSLQSVKAIDRCVESSSAFSRLIGTKAHGTGEWGRGQSERTLASPSYVFLLTFETNPISNKDADASLSLHLEPLEIVYSPTAECWGRLASFTSTPEALGLWAEMEVAVLNEFASFKARTEAKLEYVLANRIALAIDARVRVRL